MTYAPPGSSGEWRAIRGDSPLAAMARVLACVPLLELVTWPQVDLNLSDALGTEPIKFAIEFKWRQFGRKYFFGLAIALRSAQFAPGIIARYLLLLAFVTGTVIGAMPCRQACPCNSLRPGQHLASV